MKKERKKDQKRKEKKRTKKRVKNAWTKLEKERQNKKEEP